MKPIILTAILFCFYSNLPSQELNDISFAKKYPRSSLDQIVLSQKEWQPFPTYSNPKGLETLPPKVRQAYVMAAEELLDTEWHPFPATVFLQYARNGNRSNYQALSFSRREKLATLVLGELFERKGRFMDQIVNGIWAVCEESYWGVPAHNDGRGLPDVKRPIVDLFAAETGAMMAWIHYLLAPQLDEINPLITQRMIGETDERILTPYMEHNDWGWMGYGWRNRTGYARPVNNWNPWINSNVITCALLLEKEPGRRLDILYKTMDSIDNFILPYPADGGCDEGPSYWGRAGASLFDCLELLHSASNGQINLFDHSLIQNIGAFIYKAYISSPYYLNFADASAKMNIAAPLVYRYGAAIGDETMQQFAAFGAKEQNLGSSTLDGSFGVFTRTLPALFTLDDLLATKAVEPLLRDVWLPNIQVMAARSQKGSTAGFYVAAKGGHNDESHNHNDIGNFVIYHDGSPVLIDAGAQTYTRKTFSSQRYELWNNQSGYHNVPTINGVMQKEGHQFKAKDVRYKANRRKVELVLDIAGAYPEEAQVQSWQRTITLNRLKNIVLVDKFKLTSALEPVEFNFLTPLAVSTDKSGQIKLYDSTMQKEFTLVHHKKMQSTIETISITDNRMSNSWGETIYRIVLKAPDSKLNGKYTFQIKD